MALRVVAFADDASLRDRLIAEVDALADCEIVAAGAVGEEELAAMPADVAVWDLGWDLSAARAHLTRTVETNLPVLVLGPAGLGAEAVAAGARGYLRRDSAGPRLRAALQAVAQGLQVIDAVAVESRVEDAAAEDLTPREMDVLQLLAEGLPKKEIGRRLRISEHTVKFHVNTILAKLGARTRTEAVTRAARQGLIML